MTGHQPGLLSEIVVVSSNHRTVDKIGVLVGHAGREKRNGCWCYRAPSLTQCFVPVDLGMRGGTCRFFVLQFMLALGGYKEALKRPSEDRVKIESTQRLSVLSYLLSSDIVFSTVNVQDNTLDIQQSTGQTHPDTIAQLRLICAGGDSADH